MSRDVVKYHNDMNKVNLGVFSTKELDLFFSICFKLKEQGTNEIKISFDDIKFLIGEVKNPKRVKLHVDNLNKKLAQLNYQFEINPNIFERFVLFTNFTSNYNDNSLTIKVNDKFGYLLNNLIGNFTKFELEQFVNLKSSYSKNMFKLLKQWESKKEREFKIDEFRELLAIPPKYRMSIIDIKVLTPIMEELPQYFFNLKLEKIKTGRSITSLKFSWENKKLEKKDIIDIIEIKISEKLNNTIQKVRKNRFLEKLLTIDNIEKLLEIFEENNLIKGLLWAYKEVRQDISTLEYLIKTIKTGIEKKEKKIIVKPIEKIENIFEKTSEEILLKIEEETIKNENQEVEDAITKEKIIVDQYEELYKKYLEKNKTSHNPFVRKAFDISNKYKYEIIENNEEDNKKPPLHTLEELPEKSQNETKEKYMNEIHGIAKEIRKYISEQKLEIERLSSNILSRKINQNKINQYQEENEFLEQLVCEFEMWGVRLTTYTGYELLGEVEKRFNENIAETVEIFNLIFERMDIEKRLDKEFFENMIAYCIDTKSSSVENLSTSKLKRRFSLADISEDKLLSKSGKKLVGGALIFRLEKIAKEEKIEIEYNGRIII
ncbi:MAG: replication initiation protein [Cetobacterium sp.]